MQMIVKIQLPLASNAEEPEALATDERREFMRFVPITKELSDVMDGRPKKYFNAQLTESELILGAEVPNPGW